MTHPEVQPFRRSSVDSETHAIRCHSSSSASSRILATKCPVILASN